MTTPAERTEGFKPPKQEQSIVSIGGAEASWSLRWKVSAAWVCVTVAVKVIGSAPPVRPPDFGMTVLN